MTDELKALLEKIDKGEFADLSTEQLTQVQGEITESLTAWRADKSLYSATEVKSMTAALTSVKGQIESRTSEDQALEDEVKALVPDAPQVETPEPVKTGNLAAVLEKRPAAATPAPEPPVVVEPEPEAEPAVEVIAASGAPGSSVSEDAPRLSPAEAAQTLWDSHRRMKAPAQGSVQTRALQRRWNAAFRVDEGASGQANYTAYSNAVMAGQERAKAALYGDEVIQAATGICGPLEPRYSFLNLADANAGIIDLVDVGVARGGLRLPQAVTFDDIRGQSAVAYPYTSQMGADAGTKPCWEVECPGISDFMVIAYQTCQRFGNFTNQFFPEYVDMISNLAMAGHAHDVNLALILGIVASADTVTFESNGNTKLGDAWVQFTRQATFHAFLYRDQQRTSQDLVLEQVWSYRALGALIAAVMARTSSEPTAAAFAVREAVNAFGRTIGVRFQFVYDWQEMAQAPGDFGSEFYSFLEFPAGEVVHMTGESLDFGPVRDSTRNAANEFDMWFESFDGLAFSGYPIHYVTEVRLCPNGETGNTAAILCSTGS